MASVLAIEALEEGSIDVSAPQGEAEQQQPLLAACCSADTGKGPVEPEVNISSIKLDKESRLEKIDALWKERSLISFNNTNNSGASGMGSIFCWNCKVLTFIVWEKCSLILEVLSVLAAYYLDVILDFRMCVTFWQYHDKLFLATSAMGILCALVFTMQEMNREVSAMKERGVSLEGLETQLVIIGFLMPFQGHMAFICLRSIYDGRTHMFLYTTKLAESVVEATISGSVQTYATIFHDLSKRDMIVAYMSIGLSYISMALAFTSFDKRDKGLASLPGVAEGWTSRRGSLILVMICRCCEVCSRITSFGLFQLALRNETVVGKFPVGVLLAFDTMAMFIMITVSQWSQGFAWNGLQYAIPSSIGFMNPLLASKNTHTMSAPIYYSFRVVELAGMCALMYCFAEWHGKDDIHDHDPKNNLFYRAAFAKEFANDMVPIYAFVASTIGWMFLVPFIRVFCTDDVLMQDRRIFRAKQFDRLKDNLCQDLLLIQERMNHQQLRRAIQFHRICDFVLRKEVARFREELHRDLRSGSFRLSHSTSRQNIDTDCLQVWLHIQMEHERKKEGAADFIGEGFMDLVRVWFNTNYYLQAETYSDSKILDDPNLQRSKKELKKLEGGKDSLHLTVLESACSALRDDRVQGTFRNIATIQMLLRVIPSWPQEWDRPGDAKQSDHKRVFVSKCELVTACMKQGWHFHRSAFAEDAKSLIDKFDARSKEQLQCLVGDDLWFVCTTQLIALVKMWRYVPTDSRPCVFRTDIEMRAIFEGAGMLASRSTPITRILRNVQEVQAFLGRVSDDLMVYSLPDRRNDRSSLFVDDFYQEVRQATRQQVRSVREVKQGAEAKEVRSFAELQTLLSVEEVGGAMDAAARSFELQLFGLEEVERTTDFLDLVRQMGCEDLRSLQQNRANSFRNTGLLQMGNSIQMRDLEMLLRLSADVDEERLHMSFNQTPESRLGLDLIQDADALQILAVSPGGLAEKWNQDVQAHRIIGRQLKPGDRIIKVNLFEADSSMLLAEIGRDQETTLQIEDSVHTMLQQFSGFCDVVIDSTVEYLDEKLQQLKRYIEMEVDPRTADFCETYRQEIEKTTPTIAFVGEYKTSNYNKIYEAEELIDKLVEFIKVVEKRFDAVGEVTADHRVNMWSLPVLTKVKDVQETVTDMRSSMREEISQFWNNEESKVTKEAQRQEKQAQKRKKEAEAASLKAAKDAQIAKERKEQAEAEQAKAEAARIQAEREKSQAEREKEAAKTAENDADAARLRAEEKARQAQEAEKRASAEKEQAQKEKEGAKKAQKEAEDRLKTARQEQEKSRLEAEAAKRSATDAKKKLEKTIAAQHREAKKNLEEQQRAIKASHAEAEIARKKQEELTQMIEEIKNMKPAEQPGALRRLYNKLTER